MINKPKMSPMKSLSELSSSGSGNSLVLKFKKSFDNLGCFPEELMPLHVYMDKAKEFYKLFEDETPPENYRKYAMDVLNYKHILQFSIEPNLFVKISERDSPLFKGFTYEVEEVPAGICYKVRTPEWHISMVDISTVLVFHDRAKYGKIREQYYIHNLHDLAEATWVHPNSRNFF